MGQLTLVSALEIGTLAAVNALYEEARVTG